MLAGGTSPAACRRDVKRSIFPQADPSGRKCLEIRLSWLHGVRYPAVGGSTLVHLKLVLLFLFSLPSLRSAIVYDNGLPNYFDGYEMTGWWQADDFSLSSQTTLNQIRFWTAESPGDFSGTFFWAIWSDVSGIPGVSLFSGSGTPVRTATGNTALALDEYENFLDLGVLLDPGTYWISLHNGPLTSTTAAQVFWLTSDFNASADGQEFDLSGSGSWSSVGAQHAFQLTSTSEVPEPGSAILIVSGLLILAWRRKATRNTLAATLRPRCSALPGVAVALIAASPLLAVDALTPGTPTLERPTLTAIGILLPITGDDNFNASVSVRYRVQSTSAWKPAQNLYRVRPDTISTPGIGPQFSGSLLDLRPATTYDIELRAVDPDNPLDQTISLSATTRAVPPADPATPRIVNVNSPATFQTALTNAQPGDVITLADGVYTGSFFTLSRAGTLANPIVIRGAGTQAILDGEGCTACNVLDIYGGGFVTIERLTIRNALRAIRFQTAGATGNVVRRVRMENVTLGIGSRQNQFDFYIADNVVQGRLSWPLIVSDDAALHASEYGIVVEGEGHVVANNQLSGFGDAIVIGPGGGRAIDFVGNEILWTYDNALELDGGISNIRAARNRITNAFMPISLQPIVAGPAYVYRNVLFNAVDEPYKFHAQAVTPPREPNGVLVYNNSSWMYRYAIRVWTQAPSHHTVMMNNILMGPSATAFGITADWTALINNGRFDYNGYFPAGAFYFNRGVYQGFPSLAALQATGVETNSRILNSNTFPNGLVAPASYLTLQSPVSPELAPGSLALDTGLSIANINANYRGAGPDLGAHENGCPLPTYGPRASGVDESNQVTGCETTGNAAFLTVDTQTRGSWRGRYGAQGQVIAGLGSQLPAWASVTTTASSTVWAASSSSLRALHKIPPANDRIASAWTTPSPVLLDIDIRDTTPHRVALYFLDWNGAPPRQQTVRILDQNGELLHQHSLVNSQAGVWLSWNLTGRVRVEVTATAGAGPAVSGVFID